MERRHVASYTRTAEQYAKSRRQCAIDGMSMQEVVSMCIDAYVKAPKEVLELSKR